MLKKVGEIFDGVEKVLKVTTAALMIAFSVLTLLQVVMRYAFGSPLSWSEQTSRYLFVWMLMLYMPVIMRDKGNMSFDLLTRKLPKMAQEALTLACELLIAAFGLLYCVYSTQLCVRFAGKVMVGIGIAAPWVYASQIVGAGLLFLFTAELIIHHIRTMNREPGKEGSAV